MGFLDWLNSFIAHTSDVVKAFVLVAAVVVVLVVAVQVRFAVGKTLVTALIAGFVVWLVSFNGLSWIAQRLNGETTAAGVSHSSVLADPLSGPGGS